MKFRRSMRNLLFVGFGLIIVLLCLITSVAIATIFTLRDSDAVVYQQLTQAELARSLQYEIVAANQACDDALTVQPSVAKDAWQRYQSHVHMIIRIEKSLTALPLTQTGVVTLAIFDNQWADYLKHNTLLFEIFQHGNTVIAEKSKPSPNAVLDTLELFVGQTVTTSAQARTKAMDISATSPTTMIVISILALFFGSSFIWLLVQRINRITDRLAGSLEEVRSSHDALEEANTRLQQLATSDPLTELPNHRTLITLLDEALEHALHTSSSCSFLFLDFDHFKSINDQYGHPAGDAILCELAVIIRSAIREGDLLGRWGGEEFGVILPGIDHEEAFLIAERVRVTIASHLFAIAGGVHMTCSIGIASYRHDALQRDELIEIADQAMYAAKHLGRNRVCTRQDLINTSFQTHLSNSPEEMSLMEVAEALSCVVAARDCGTGLHTEAVGTMVRQVAVEMGLTLKEATMLQIAGRLHDLGKIAIPDAILHKAGPLTEEEWDIMHLHPGIGEQIVSQVPALSSVASSIRGHHERWDGMGYPDRLAQMAIPLGARILAVVDAYEAMTTDRPYRKAVEVQWAFQELCRCAATQFDPQVVAAFERVLVQNGILPTLITAKTA